MNSKFCDSRSRFRQPRSRSETRKANQNFVRMLKFWFLDFAIQSVVNKSLGRCKRLKGSLLGEVRGMIGANSAARHLHYNFPKTKAALQNRDSQS